MSVVSAAEAAAPAGGEGAAVGAGLEADSVAEALDDLDAAVDGAVVVDDDFDVRTLVERATGRLSDQALGVVAGAKTGVRFSSAASAMLPVLMVHAVRSKSASSSAMRPSLPAFLLLQRILS